MKLDQNTNQTEQSDKSMVKRNEIQRSGSSANSLLDLLNPLKTININSDLHSFYNYRESKESVLKLLKAQTNLVFYVLHQTFMCDEENKRFFKDMVGRFYDLDQRFWSYYRGIDCLVDAVGNRKGIFGLILLENANLYDQVVSEGNNSILVKDFYINDGSKRYVSFFNRLCLEELWGISCNNPITAYYIPSNKKNKTIRTNGNTRKSLWGFDYRYEYGRFAPYQIKLPENNEFYNWWYTVTLDEIRQLDNFPIDLSEYLSLYGVYASIGLEKQAEIIEVIKQRAKELSIEFDDSWIPEWHQVEIRRINSLSQTFDWTKEYIINNYEELDLDILGLNLTVPWDIELVKFFIEKGYGGRMSENKAVFDEVFNPLLDDEILEMIFKLEYIKL